MKIVLVDDDSAVRKIILNYLDNEGHEVIEASNGREALQVIENHDPDLVISDNKMPVMTGLDLLKAVRRKCDVPFVLMTGFAETEIVVEALNNRAFYFIHKPMNLFEIKAVIDQLKERLDLEKKVEELHLKLSRFSTMAELGQIASLLVNEIKSQLEIAEDNIRIVHEEITALDNKAPQKKITKIEALQKSQQACQSVREMVGNLEEVVKSQDFSARHDFDLNECLEEVLGIIVRNGDVNVRKKLGENLYCKGDRLQMSQVFADLLLNAYEATANVVDKRIDIETFAEKGECFACILDNGPGIAEDDASRIFTPFFSTKNKEKHKGLGLAKACKIMNSMGGSLSFTCPDSGGTVFEVRIPAAQI